MPGTLGQNFKAKNWLDLKSYLIPVAKTSKTFSAEEKASLNIA